MKFLVFEELVRYQVLNGQRFYHQVVRGFPGGIEGTALPEVKTLRAILPICSDCKKIRDDKNYWQSVEAYISRHTNATFSHGICPACFEREVEPELDSANRR